MATHIFFQTQCTFIYLYIKTNTIFRFIIRQVFPMHNNDQQIRFFYQTVNRIFFMEISNQTRFIIFSFAFKFCINMQWTHQEFVWKSIISRIFTAQIRFSIWIKIQNMNKKPNSLSKNRQHDPLDHDPTTNSHRSSRA